MSPVRCALRVPYTTSLKVLVRRLRRCGKDDYELGEAVYTWVAKHIRYDTRALYDTTHIAAVSPENVLKRRKTICAGYANLMVRILRSMGIVAYKVVGEAKGYSDLKHPIDVDGHAWVIFYSKAKGRWILSDPTWGAGYVSKDNRRFYPRFERFYYDVSPSAMIYTHYPEGIYGEPIGDLIPDLTEYRRWNGKVITEGQFLAMPRPSEIFIKKGFVFVGPDSSILSMDFFGRYDVEMRGPKGYVFYAKPLGRRLLQPLHYMWVDTLPSDTPIYRLHLLWPDTGRYVVEVWMRDLKTGEEFLAFTKLFYSRTSYWILDMDYPYGKGFVKVYDRFYGMGAYLYGPINGFFMEGDTAVLHIKVPHTKRVWVLSGGRRFDIDREKGDVFKGKFVAHGRRITVWADGKLILRYTVLKE